MFFFKIIHILGKAVCYVKMTARIQLPYKTDTTAVYVDVETGHGYNCHVGSLKLGILIEIANAN
jgi:hypothetical protein